MKTQSHYLTTAEVIDGAQAPIDLSVIPNMMGVNLNSVAGVEWTQREDGQLVSLTFHFLPAKDEKSGAEEKDF